MNTKRIMNHYGFKQNAIARRSGIKEASFSNMMNGRKAITEPDIISIANALGVEANELFKHSKEAS